MDKSLQDLAGGSEGLIAFLGLQTEPAPAQVVRHLLFCSGHDIEVNKEVYRFLQENANHPTVGQLRQQRCLLLADGQYVRPDQVYWSEHPFGRYRYQLGPELRRYGTLFDRLGVREKPEDSGFIQVMLDIHAAYGQDRKALDEETRTVVMRCWEGLSSALESESLEAGDLSVLRGKEVVPGTHNCLEKPEYLYFEDRAGLAARFATLLRNRLIVRPQGAWRAMEAAGVRQLSQAVDAYLWECSDPVNDHQVAKRVRERKYLVARVIESVEQSTSDVVDLSAIDRLHFMQVRELVIKYALKEWPEGTEPEAVPAILVPDDDKLYIVHQNGQIPWAAVAREIAYAVKPLGEVGSLASGIKEALSGDSLEEASSILDELGYPPLMLKPDGTVLPSQVIELGGTTTEKSVEAILGGDAARHPAPETPLETPTIPSPRVAPEVPRPKPKPKSRLRTYVVSGEEESNDDKAGTKHKDHRSDVERAGVSHVLDYEKAQGRTPTEMPHFNPGYDIESRDKRGQIRYIEVKSLDGEWAIDNPAIVTRREFKTAGEHGDLFWLYVVERARRDDFRIFSIQNPANRVNEYLYDDGWSGLAEVGSDSKD